jgi:hypothetical protein
MRRIAHMTTQIVHFVIALLGGQGQTAAVRTHLLPLQRHWSCHGLTSTCCIMCVCLGHTSPLLARLCLARFVLAPTYRRCVLVSLCCHSFVHNACMQPHRMMPTTGHVHGAVCNGTDACPAKPLAGGGQQAASTCTSATLMPQPGEITKRFGCICAGLPSDKVVQNICEKQQPFTHWMFEMRPDSSNDSLLNRTGFSMSMYERAGTPANVRPALCCRAQLEVNVEFESNLLSADCAMSPRMHLHMRASCSVFLCIISGRMLHDKPSRIFLQLAQSGRHRHALDLCNHSEAEHLVEHGKHLVLEVPPVTSPNSCEQ